MAATRKQDKRIVGDSLDAFVQNLNRLYGNQLTVRNTKLELDFQEKVAGGGLSLDDQLAYRKQQLTEVQDDPNEKTRLRGEISTLRTKVAQEKFTQDYAGKIADFQAGVASIDSVISFLTASRDATNDPTILDTIASKLADAQSQKFTITQNVIKAQSEYAVNSKSSDIINTQIAKVTSARANAVLNGDNETVAVLDLQLQNLNQEKSNVQVQQDVLNLGALSTTGAVDAVGMLNTMNGKIANASGDSGPVTVGGTTYPSIAAFWTAKRDTYVSDQSSNGFFGSLDTELKNNISTLSSKNALTTSSLMDITSIFGKLSAMPELAPYAKQIDMYKQDVLQNGANAISDTITNQFARDMNIGNAVASLNTLKAMGVNVDTAYTKILQSAASTKNSQVQNILTAAQNAMANNPSLTPEAAIAAAVASGAGTVITPEQAVNTPESKLAGDAAATAAAGKGTDVPATTIPGATPAPTPTTTPAPGAAGLPNVALQPGSTDAASVNKLQDYLVANGYLSAEDRATGPGIYGPKTTAAVAALQAKLGVDNSSGVGFFGPHTIAALNTPAPTSTTAAAPVSTPTPTPAPTPTAPASSPTTVSQPVTAPAPVVAAPAPVTSAGPKATSFTKLANGNVDIKYADGTSGRSTLEYAKSIGYTGT